MASASGGFDFSVEAKAEVSASASASVEASVSAGFDFSVAVGGGGGNAPGSRRDPFRGYNFAVEIEGLVAGGFSDVTGLQVELEVQDYREGGVNGFIHKRAGPAKYTANLVLKRGMTDAKALWNWYWDVVQGKVERKNVSVLLLDEAGEEKMRWNFAQAYPVKWTGPDLRATGNEVAVESIELAHKGLMSVA
jgi:phage tail-like protein